MRLRIALSARVQTVVDSLSDRAFADFQQVEEHLAVFLPGLVNGGLVVPYTLYGVVGFQYYDHKFPYQIFFQRLVDEDTEIEFLQIYLMLRADPHPSR